ncbi:hypothetical protein BDV30DRAFT_235641 [Aspergillus minisclerotigenes]|uniref:DUF3638 domain-containing protein n=1 Tax=Aspergillus minisclerotigenes TaxID=656917 RepID=A0A5N6JE73_9EURO|nr:hypothetical protein BDV30DRAFT_235641 [Aspergillus minisclerotigenes]
MVASSLADSSRLVRVIVANTPGKANVSNAGFELGSMQAKEVILKCQECMTNGGVLLVQPEQTLSLKLMALERMIARDFDVAHSLLKTLEFFREHSHDVVDESDEKPSAKFELVYTIGDQQPVQLIPERWLIADEVLDLIRRYTEVVKTKFPHLVEVGASQEGSFPHMHIFGANAQRGLIDYIAAHICETGLSGFPIARQPKTVREAVRITLPN